MPCCEPVNCPTVVTSTFVGLHLFVSLTTTVEELLAVLVQGTVRAETFASTIKYYALM